MARRRRWPARDSATAPFSPLVPLAEEPGVITQIFNRKEIAELARLQAAEHEGADGVVTIRFTLADIVDELHASPLSPPQAERSLYFEAWAFAFEAAAERIRALKERPPVLMPAPKRPDRKRGS